MQIYLLSLVFLAFLQTFRNVYLVMALWNLLNDTFILRGAHCSCYEAYVSWRKRLTSITILDVSEKMWSCSNLQCGHKKVQRFKRLVFPDSNFLLLYLFFIWYYFFFLQIWITLAPIFMYFSESKINHVLFPHFKITFHWKSYLNNPQ